MKVEELDFIDRIALEAYYVNLWGHLNRERDYYQAVLSKLPGDMTALRAEDKIKNDMAILEPLVKGIQIKNLKEVEKITGKKFLYLGAKK